MFSSGIPTAMAKRLWVTSIRYSPWMGTKNLGRTRLRRNFNSSWEAWPEAWMPEKGEWITSAPSLRSRSITRPTTRSLPGMGLAEMMTVSPGRMDTFRCSWAAIRLRADMGSPWEPVVRMVIWWGL